MRYQTRALAIFCTCLVLAACGSDKTATPSQQANEETLPQPDAAAGSVTGMPNPGTPAALPAPAGNLVTDNEDPVNEDAEIATDDASPVDPGQPAAPPTMTVEGTPGKPPADAMPVMPAHPPHAPEASEQSQVTAPPHS